MICIVPNHVTEAINAKLDAAIQAVPEAAKEREALFNGLLRIYDNTGEIPEFKIERRKP